MEHMDKSPTINSIVRVLSMILAVLFNSFLWCWNWLFNSGRDWIYTIFSTIAVIALMIAIIGLINAALIEAHCKVECKTQRQAETIKLFQALVNDCTERGITVETCEALALQTVGD